MSLSDIDSRIMDERAYKEALDQARKELEELLTQELELTTRIAKLRRTIVSLAQLCGEQPYPPAVLSSYLNPANMRLVDACREVLRDSIDPLTAEEIREGLIRIGYNTNQVNILASIHTTLRRMAESGAVKEFEKDGKKAYRFKVLPPGIGAAFVTPSSTSPEKE